MARLTPSTHYFCQPCCMSFHYDGESIIMRSHGGERGRGRASCQEVAKTATTGARLSRSRRRAFATFRVTRPGCPDSRTKYGHEAKLDIVRARSLSHDIRDQIKAFRFCLKIVPNSQKVLEINRYVYALVTCLMSSRLRAFTQLALSSQVHMKLRCRDHRVTIQSFWQRSGCHSTYPVQVSLLTYSTDQRYRVLPTAVR